MIILTGAAGFIGANILRRLNSLKIYDIIIVDEINDTGKWEQIIGCQFIEYVNKNNLFDFLSNYNKRIKGIIHMGACSSTTELDFDYLYENNFVYSQKLWNYCSDKKINFVYASSAATYGSGENGFSDDHEKLNSLKPINAYGYTKHLFDLWAMSQNNQPNHWAGLKFFNVYGPFEKFKGEMASVARRGIIQVHSDRAIRLFKSDNIKYEDGEQKRDFIFVDDVVSVVMHFYEGNGIAGIYNVGTGNAQTFNDIGNAIIGNYGNSAKIKYIPMPEKLIGSYQYFTQADISKLRSVGYNNEFHTVKEGVNKMFNNLSYVI
jgi:ADP-L-glycero-D-manno-heptose 6-epimerase